MSTWFYVRSAALIVALGATVAGCGSDTPVSPTAPAAGTTATTVTPTPIPTPTPAGSGLANGIWSGTGVDSFSPELVRLVITQTGTDLSGTAELNAVNPGDGTCGSCHKVKKGTVAGTLAGSSVTLALTFPPGGDSPTPICATAFKAVGTVAGGRLSATYTGTDTCEGIYANGSIDLTQQ